MEWILPIIAFMLAFAGVAIGMPRLIEALHNRAILDHPNHRSSHKTPTVKGGGLLLIPVVAVLWCGYALLTQSENSLQIILVSIISLGIAAISWIDDLYQLSAKLRLLIHFLAASAAVYAMSDEQFIFQGLIPPLADHTIAVISLVWFINLFNFMDGIDGITGVQTSLIAVGVIICGAATMIPYAGIILGATLAFLIWNWRPAKIFLGDTGSAPLGFILGWLLLSLAGEGQWQAALILPGYYLADATLTLAKRAFRGERIWQAHNQHFYQKAVKAGKSHASVSQLILLEGLFLIGCAYLSTMEKQPYGPIGLIFSVLSVVALLLYFNAQRARK